MTTPIAELQKYVTKVIVWMLADRKDAEITQNVNTQYTMLDVNAFQAILEIHSAAASHVSSNLLTCLILMKKQLQFNN